MHLAFYWRSLADGVELTEHFSFYLDEMLVALFGKHRVISIRVEDIHSFEVKRTDSSHERFFQIFLHINFLQIIALDRPVSFFETLAQCFNLFAVASRNILHFKLNRPLEFFLIILLFPD